MKTCFLIPVYNHKDVLGYILDYLAVHKLPCIMIDDGSDADCRDEIQRQAMARDWVIADRLPVNGGKGAAVLRGLELARSMGFTHVFQLDADGQHDLADVKKFLDVAASNRDALVLGQARYDESVPKARLYGRHITHFWVWIETLSFTIRDSMCGFRIYPVDSALKAGRGGRIGKRMTFDIEIVVRMVWLGVPVVSVPTHVTYPKDGISHFDMLRDNLEISGMHTLLVVEMLLRFPAILFRRWRRRRPAVSGGARDEG